MFYNKVNCFALDFLSQYVDLRTRYSELMTLNNQYIKFIIETQRRLEDEEVCTRCRVLLHSAVLNYLKALQNCYMITTNVSTSSEHVM